MIHLINEGNSELKNRVFPLAKGIREHLQSVLDGYQGDKTVDGYKRLNNILSMKNGVSYNEMKRIKNFFDNYSGTDKSAEYLLNGGEPMKIWVDNTLNTATKAVHDFKQAKKDAGISNAFIKSHEKDRQSKKKNKPTQAKFKNGNKEMMGNNSLRYEGILREGIEDHPYYDALCDITPYTVLMDFYENPKGSQNWAPLINPSMYKKALDEFTRFGRLDKFPSKYVYQWMGIIMRNTAQLRANTTLAGHDTYYPTDDFEEFLGSYFSDRDWELNDNKLTYTDEEGNKKTEDIGDFCYEIGLYDWMTAPDGSDAWSDFGLNPIEQLISQYDQNQSPEDVLVLINKILDVYHSRGDLASMFIQGGTNTLMKISNGGMMESKKVIYVTEEQIRKVKAKLDEAQNDVFSFETLSSLPSYKKRYNYCIQNLGAPQGRGSSRVCFQLSDEKILKLAYNEKGVAQNMNEYDGYLDQLGIVPHTYDMDDNGLWIVSEYVLPAKANDFKQCLGLTFDEFVKFLKTSFAWRMKYTQAKAGYFGDSIYPHEKYEELLENEDLCAFDDYIGGYTPPAGDLMTIRNYGMASRDGSPTMVLLDAGLSEEVWNTYYKKY